MIAGQGAAGYAAALYAARYGLTLIVCGEAFGGETATGGMIENYPGPGIVKFKEQVTAAAQSAIAAFSAYHYIMSGGPH